MQDAVELYKKQALHFEQKYNEATAQNNYLKAQIDQLKRLIFGVKTERFIPEQIPGQMMLSLGAETIIESIVTQTTQVEQHQRKALKTENKPVRSALPADLPRIETVIEPEGDLSNCKKK